MVTAFRLDEQYDWPSRNPGTSVNIKHTRKVSCATFRLEDEGLDTVLERDGKVSTGHTWDGLILLYLLDRSTELLDNENSKRSECSRRIDEGMVERTKVYSRRRHPEAWCTKDVMQAAFLELYASYISLLG
jgi:hypothetical protein